MRYALPILHSNSLPNSCNISKCLVQYGQPIKKGDESVRPAGL